MQPGQTSKCYDIAIVGGGMVGASLALSLSQNTSLRILVIDQQSLKPSMVDAETPFSPRVSALTEASIQLFNRLDVWGDMQTQRVCPYRHMQVWDGEGTGEISFDANKVGHTHLGYIAENTVIRAALLKGLETADVDLLEASENATFHSKSDGIEIRLASGGTVQSRLVVGADGARSVVRTWAGIPSTVKDCLHHAIVTTVETERYHQDTAWQIFLDTGPLAFLPLPDKGGKHYCSIVWSVLPDIKDDVLALNDESFCNKLGRAFEHRLGNIHGADPRVSYPLKHRHAKQYYRGNVVLVGDAAHTIHPLAGQGVNLGLQDVEALSKELIRACERGDDIAGEHILARYQRSRRAENQLMMTAMDGFQHLFHTNDLAVRWLRNTGLRMTDQSPFIKESLIKHAMGL